MQVTLEAMAGAAAGKPLRLRSGESARVGRTGDAQLVVHDSLMSNVHFELACGESACIVKDLGSRFGTQVNRSPITEATLRDGDQITAGQTTFVVRIQSGAVSLPTGPSAPGPNPLGAAGPAADGTAKVLEQLRAMREPLFAVVDAARDPKVLGLLKGSQEKYQSLLEGVQGEALALWAPYLVALPASSPLLPALLQEGWNDALGIYLTCGLPFADVRKHLRHFLTVRDDEQDDLFFRFYDPRVLRTFLPVCTPEELAAFFGPITSFLLEARQTGKLCRYEVKARELRMTELT